jgi:CDP-glycerol glycerophosphotransferase
MCGGVCEEGVKPSSSPLGHIFYTSRVWPSDTMVIVFQSFAGRFSDSPRALFEALSRENHDDEHVWLLADDVRDGLEADVVESRPWGSAAAREALEAADVLVANTHTDVPWTKKPGATYLQTWHGTPLKRIHRDVLWAPEGRLDRLDGDVARWDVLLSPNAASTPLLRQAFRYDGELLESGYPRNDVLSAPDRDQRRAAVRRRLGIGPDQQAVLYAPTWRDDAVFAEGGKDFMLGLDPERVGAALAPSDGVLLLRLHHELTARSAAIDHPRVREVSRHPDISDLYLAADALVTDYSSVMFDFAITGRPIVFYAYDLDDYRDRLRGFYFPLEPEAPGPIVTTEDALIATLDDLPAVAAAHADRYARFRERYCHLEDGHATERVLARLAACRG